MGLFSFVFWAALFILVMKLKSNLNYLMGGVLIVLLFNFQTQISNPMLVFIIYAMAQYSKPKDTLNKSVLN